MPSDQYPQNHEFPHGQMVWNYEGQLAGTDHKFGGHQLTVDCTCGPIITPTTVGQAVKHVTPA